MSLTSDADIVRTQGALGFGAEPGRSTPEAAPKHPVPSLGEDLGGYCQVQNLRELLTEGRFSVDDLPDSVDDTEVDGSPRIIDYTVAPGSVLGHYAQLDAVVDAVARVDERLASTLWTGDSEDKLRECAASSTEPDVRRTQGDTGYAADR
ncbi:hypothetical protein ACHAAC_15685 [Aeromicrobium sp. CF4.19]|uniref:hypothetical protein n=1 Tax=Aeromicrobium sp. CF4.19 TaxID=3373082 RepID=UPI003EE6E649